MRRALLTGGDRRCRSSRLAWAAERRAAARVHEGRSGACAGRLAEALRLRRRAGQPRPPRAPPPAPSRAARTTTPTSPIWSRPGKYDSPDFTRTADHSFVSVSTGVFKTAAMAKRGYARVAVRQLPACFGELFAKGITKPSSAKVVSAGPIAFPKAGDRSNAYRLVASVKTPTVTLPVTADIVLFNKGRTDVAMIFLGIARPLPASLEQTAVCARARARHQVARDPAAASAILTGGGVPTRARLLSIRCRLEDDAETRNRSWRRPRGERPLRSPALGTDPDVPVLVGGPSAPVGPPHRRPHPALDRDRSDDAGHRVRGRPLPLVPRERLGHPGALEGRKGGADGPRRAAAPRTCGHRADHRLRPPRERSCRNAVAVGHGDAGPHRPVERTPCR